MNNKRKIPVVTLALIAINLAGIISEKVMYHTTSPIFQIIWSEFYISSIKLGDWWRLITPTFFHTGIVHFLADMASLFVVGSTIELVYGKVKLISVFFIGVLSGNITELVYGLATGDDIHAMMGTSAAILSITIAVLIATISCRSSVSWRRVMICCIATALMMVANNGTGTTSRALLGSVLGGFLSGIFLLKKREK